MSDKLKEYLWSSLTTFISTFAVTAVALLQNVPLETGMEWGFWVGLIMTAGRAATKAALQYFLSGKVGERFGAKGRV